MAAAHVKTPPISDPIWVEWTGALRAYLEAGGDDPQRWCVARGLNKWTTVNLIAAAELVDGPTFGVPPNLDDEMPVMNRDVNIGSVYGCLVVLAISGKRNQKQFYYRVRCTNCDEEFDVFRSGSIKAAPTECKVAHAATVSRSGKAA